MTVGGFGPGLLESCMQKTQEEIDEMSPAELRAYREDQRRTVFGHDSKTDRKGHPIEQGIGSPAHPTRNSIDAYKHTQLVRMSEPEPGFPENLKRMEDELAEFEANRKVA